MQCGSEHLNIRAITTGQMLHGECPVMAVSVLAYAVTEALDFFTTKLKSGV
jgi:hypothetical protein